MASATVTLWTDYRAAGGTRLGSLPVVEGVEKTSVEGNDLTNVVVPKARWTELAGDLRHVLRVEWPTGEIVERRIVRVKTQDGSPVTELECLPIFDDLATGGPILRVVGGSVVTKVAGELTVSQVLTTYVLPHAAAQRIGLAIGTIERDTVVQFDLDAPTPAALILDVFNKAKLEAELVRTSDTVWTLNGRRQRGSTASALRIRSARNQQQLALGVDDNELATVVVPLGDADPETGDRATIATAQWAVHAIASGWVQLRDPGDSTLSPIAVDTQWVSAYVVTRGGFAQQIVSSRVSDGAVQLAGTAGLAVGDRVRIAADAAGTPLAEVYDSSATGSRRRTVVLNLSGVRGEANEIRNGRFQDGLAQWTGANVTSPPAYADVPRSELNTTKTGKASAARAAATGTGTPFTIKNLPANSFVRQSSEMVVGGATLSVTADAVATTGGGLTFSVSPTTPGTYTNGTALTFKRADTRTLTLDGAQSPLSASLKFRDSNTDGILDSDSSSFTLASTSGGYTATGNTVTYVERVKGKLAGKLEAGVHGSTELLLSSITWATKASDIYTLSDAVLTYTVGEKSGTVTYVGSFGGSVAVGTRLRYRDQNNRYRVLRVTNVSGGTLSVTAEDNVPLTYWSGVTPMEACNVLLADGSTWTWTQTRDTRSLLVSGTVNAGASSIPFQNVTAIARRDWQTSDTITVRRDRSATLYPTAITFVQGGFPGVNPYQLTVTFDAASSTMDDLTLTTDWVEYAPVFVTSAGEFRLQSISGTSAVLRGPADSFTLNTTLTGTWTHPDTYTVSGNASWGANGRATVPISGTIPAGYTYARGAMVTASWDTLGPARLFASATGGGSSFDVLGVDTFTDTNASGMGPYRVIGNGGSTLPIPGNVLYAATTAQADSSGNASVTLVSANANAIALDDPVTIVTPELLRPSDPRTGSVVRLTNPVGGSNIPTSSTPGLTPLSGIPITVAANSTVPLTAFVTVALSAGTYPLGQQPAIALVDSNGTVLNWARLATGTVQAAQTPTIARLILQHTLSASTTVGLRIYGGAADRSLWQVAIDAMLCLTTRDDVPFVIGSWGNGLALRGADELASRRDPAVSVDVDLAILRRWSDAPATTPVVVGQSVELPDYGLTRRVLTVQRSLVDPDRIKVAVGVPTDTIAEQTGILLGASA